MSINSSLLHLVTVSPRAKIVAAKALDSSGNAYITGDFYGPTITFGPYTLTDSGNSDMFIAKMESGISSGIHEPGNIPGIAVYPNPATDKITVETSGIYNHDILSILNPPGIRETRLK